MSKKFVVKVYSPKGLVLEKSSEFLRLPGKSGDIGISLSVLNLTDVY